MEGKGIEELMKRYFAGYSTNEEEILFEQWLKTLPANNNLAMHLQDELFQEETLLFFVVLRSIKDVWEKTAEKTIKSPGAIEQKKILDSHAWPAYQQGKEIFNFQENLRGTSFQKRLRMLKN